jgi:hypothetical protein
MDNTGQFLQDGRHKSPPKGKSSRNSELTEKSRQLTESLKQLQQSYSSSNIQVRENENHAITKMCILKRH